MRDTIAELHNVLHRNLWGTWMLSSARPAVLRDNQEEMSSYKRHRREAGSLAGLRRIKAEIVTFICLDWVCQASVYAAEAIMAPS